MRVDLSAIETIIFSATKKGFKLEQTEGKKSRRVYSLLTSTEGLTVPREIGGYLIVTETRLELIPSRRYLEFFNEEAMREIYGSFHRMESSR